MTNASEYHRLACIHSNDNEVNISCMQALKAGRPKSEEKRKAILKAAQKLFLAQGFKQTSMVEVAKHSGVSKQTIYSHYSNKDALFSAAIAFKCEQYLIENENLADNQTTIEGALTIIGLKFLALFHDDDVISMYTTVISEARNAPRVAELFYEAGPLASTLALTEVLYEFTNRPQCTASLSKEDARSLALDFYTLLKSNLHTCSLMHLEFRLNDEERKEYVQTVVKKTMCLLENYYQ